MLQHMTAPTNVPWCLFGQDQVKLGREGLETPRVGSIQVTSMDMFHRSELRGSEYEWQSELTHGELIRRLQQDGDMPSEKWYWNATNVYRYIWEMIVFAPYGKIKYPPPDKVESGDLWFSVHKAGLFAMGLASTDENLDVVVFGNSEYKSFLYMMWQKIVHMQEIEHIKVKPILMTGAHLIVQLGSFSFSIKYMYEAQLIAQ
jgi:hypothetical protein